MNETVDQTTLPVGSSLRDYSIDQVLGVGGFGITYLATHKRLHMPVAIKEYMPREFAHRVNGFSIRPFTQINKQEFFSFGLDRFLTEARDLVRFDHQNIIKARDYFEENGTAYIVMDYAKGQTLETWLRSVNSIPDESQISNIFLPLLDGLREVHAHNLLHRDISPDNIYLQENGQPILIDFGAAKNQLGARSQSLGVIIKEGYSPKEQYAAKGKQGPYTDIYAVGASMYRAISGQIPPGSTTRIDDIDHGESDPLKSAQEIFGGQYSTKMLSTIDWCLELSATDRPQTVRDVQDALSDGSPSHKKFGTKKIKLVKKALGGSGEKSTPWYIDNQLIGSLIGVLLLCMAGVAYFLFSGGSTTEALLSTGNLKIQEAQSMQRRASREMRRLQELNVSVSDIDQRSLDQKLLRVDRLIEDGLADDALAVAEGVYAQQVSLISTGARRFGAGSTNPEIQSAFDSCVDTIGDSVCAIEWFEGEVRSSVELEPFILDKTAVSFAEFDEFVSAENYKTTAETRGISLQQVEDFDIRVLEGFNWKSPEGNQGRGFEQLKKFPVTHVSYIDAKNYCSYADKRLPTRFEWEYAISGGDMKTYSSYFSETGFGKKEYGDTRIESQQSDSPAIFDEQTGFYGGTGNVWEWTDTPDITGENKRITKGGSWNEPSVAFVRIAALRSEYYEDSYVDVGFRCARDSDRWPVK